jgi:hypothetical protein
VPPTKAPPPPHPQLHPQNPVVVCLRLPQILDKSVVVSNTYYSILATPSICHTPANSSHGGLCRFGSCLLLHCRLFVSAPVCCWRLLLVSGFSRSFEALLLAAGFLLHPVFPQYGHHNTDADTGQRCPCKTAQHRHTDATLDDPPVSPPLVKDISTLALDPAT